MSKIFIEFCNLCGKLSADNLDTLITIQKGTGKDKEVKKGDICSQCFTIISEKLDKEFDVNRLSQPQQPLHIQANTQQQAKVISDGETIIPSNLNNIAEMPGKTENKCPHDAKSFTPPNRLKCNDCGEELTA